MARLTRRGMLGGAAGAIACGADPTRPTPDTGTSGTPPPITPPGPRNIVYIYVDQHRGPFAGFYGHPLVQTPTLDALALESVRYPNMFTNSPLSEARRTSPFDPHCRGNWKP